MSLKLTKRSTGKGPNLNNLFYKPGIQFHISKNKDIINVERILNGRLTHSISSFSSMTNVVGIRPESSSTSYVWELDMDRKEFISFMSDMNNVYHTEVPNFYGSLSRVELEGESMTKESILNLIS